VVVRARPTGSRTSGNRQRTESDVVHHHIRLRQHQIAAVTRVLVRTGARQVKEAGTTERGETVGGSSSCGELSSGGGRPR
jgi:hypothetical protein